jgi:hypothetical protein
MQMVKLVSGCHDTRMSLTKEEPDRAGFTALAEPITPPLGAGPGSPLSAALRPVARIEKSRRDCVEKVDYAACCEEILKDCTEDEKAKIAGGNAARIYHLN